MRINLCVRTHRKTPLFCVRTQFLTKDRKNARGSRDGELGHGQHIIYNIDKANGG